jgi:hypothetical protein
MLHPHLIAINFFDESAGFGAVTGEPQCLVVNSYIIDRSRPDDCPVSDDEHMSTN